MFATLRMKPCAYGQAMHIREYSKNDLAALRSIHAGQGFAYPLPDLDNPLFVTKLVLSEHGEGKGPSLEPEKITAAVLLRLTAEAYLLLDPRTGSPRERWQHILALHAAAEQDAWRRGLEDVHCWLPPQIAKQFGKRITRLGWVRDDAWPPYCKKLQASTKQ